ncbi:hypothetical protein C807_01197 [Lachnospiraceae bacterium 28-4]|nr:hypothetical protein C807_01197 [Lachnospiraceae bacterium 28-4]
MKKFLSLVLSLVMLVSMGTTAFAAEKAPISFEQYATDFESFLKSATYSNTTLPDKVQTFISKYGKQYDTSELIHSEETKVIDLGNDNTVILEGIMVYVNGVEDVEATPERIAKGAVDNTASTYSAKSTSPIKKYYHAVYALVLGQELYRITQEAQFTYNGSSVSVNYSDGSYQRGFLSIWQVSDFKDSSVSSITVGGVNYARVKSSANFHYGLEIQGVGLVIQDNYCWVDARCSKTGTVKGYMDADHNLNH